MKIEEMRHRVRRSAAPIAMFGTQAGHARAVTIASRRDRLEKDTALVIGGIGRERWRDLAGSGVTGHLKSRAAPNYDRAMSTIKPGYLFSLPDGLSSEFRAQANPAMAHQDRSETGSVRQQPCRPRPSGKA